MTHSTAKRLLFFCWMIIAACAFTCSTGCKAIEKAREEKKEMKANEFFATHALPAAKFCAQHFPLKAGDTIKIMQVDSAGYEGSVNDLLQNVFYLNYVNDSLLSMLNSIDTSCKKYSPVVQGLQSRIQILQEQIKAVKPIIITHTNTVPVKDSAEANALRLDNEKLIKESLQMGSQVLHLQGQKNEFLWMFIAACLLILLLSFFLFRK